ncbi:hypothetical protein ACS0TY_023037 [Phlomoides rotata]
MVDTVLSAAADQIFTLIKEQAVYHVNLVRSAEKEVRKLGQELNTIRNVLEDAENRRFQDKSINTWLWKLRQTSYEMEDILDDWKYALLKLHNGERSPDDDDDAAPPKQKKILNVKAQLDEILKEKKKYGLKISEPTAYPLPEFGRDQSTSFINIEEVHGRGRDVDTLVDKLMGQEESGIQVLSIVGVGGLGKTTLAQLVYNHRRVKGFFDPRIWICVSDPFDRAAISKGILESIEKWSSQEDWRNWEFLKNCLKCGGAGSKILVTTRSERVAKTMGESEIFCPRLLSNDDCCGLPLAATTLGGILCFKRRLREWENVLNDEIWEMQEAEDEIFRPLLMSYKELSPTQKKCFSYCAAFPKDYEIEVKRLIGNWMALGYLGSNSDDMELKGKECFDVLAMRSLFQHFKKKDNIWDEIVSCNMHDIVHDFAQYLRKSGRVEVAAEMNKSKPCQTYDHSQVSNVNEFCTLYCDGDSPPNLCNRVVRLRVLSLASLEEIPNEIGNLSYLRHLNLSENGLKELPSEIGNLKQLRHLDLEGNNDLKELPSEIGKLSFLQTFILPIWPTIQIPEALTQLINLRKLIGFKCGSGLSKLGLLKNLNQLGFVNLLIRLDGMDLKGIVEDSREANFRDKKYIESLELEFEDEMGEEGSSRMDVIDALKPHPSLRMLSILSYKGSKLPLWIVSPANQLRKVVLYECDLTSLPSFGKLPCLEELTLDTMYALEFVGREFLGITTNTNFVAFPKLKELRFNLCSN